MDFGRAIQLLREGKALYREGWNGKGMFIVKQVPCSIGKEVIPTMQSLPLSAKVLLADRGVSSINYMNQLLLVDKDGNANSWAPSSSDVFADDWKSVGYEDTYLSRMKVEAADLYFRHEKLGEFIGGEKFATLSEKMQELIRLQYDTMTEYGKILEERITLCEGEGGK